MATRDFSANARPPTLPIAFLGTIVDSRLPRAVGRPHALDRAERLDLHAQSRPKASVQMDLAGVQRAAADGDDTRHPLRHHLVQVRHTLAGRADRRPPGRSRPDRARPTFTLAHSVDGYSDQRADEGSRRRQGHGGDPLRRQAARRPITAARPRLLVPHLYFWKSAKWINALQFTKKDEPASGSCAAITSTAIPGVSSATRTIRDHRARAIRASALAEGHDRSSIAHQSPRAVSVFLERTDRCAHEPASTSTFA